MQSTSLTALAPFTTTGIGSLPFDTITEAAAHAATAYELPFCPQLPRLEGDMVTEWLGADPYRCGWSAERDRERPVAWDAFVAQVAARPPDHGWVKLQVTGPVTLAAALERRVVARRTALAAELASWLATNVAGQVAALRALGLRALVVVDEPSLTAADAGTDGVWDPLRRAGDAWGLHLCCRVPWAVVGTAEPDLLSFDLAATPIDDRGADALRRHANRGGAVAWGVLSAHRPAGPRHAYLRLRAALGRVHVPPEQCLLTPACGTGRLSPPREHAVAAALAQVAATRRPAAVRSA